jgi:hypothetical protein
MSSRVIYHVTTSKTKVLEEGLKTRKELGLKNGIGLGASSKNEISLTTSYKDAIQIYDTLIIANRYWKGLIGREDLIQYAQQGIEAPKPYGKGIVQEFDRIREQETWFGAKEWILRKWLLRREKAGGILDPDFCDIKWKTFAKIPEEDIGILEYALKDFENKNMQFFDRPLNTVAEDFKKRFGINKQNLFDLDWEPELIWGLIKNQGRAWFDEPHIRYKDYFKLIKGELHITNKGWNSSLNY